MEVDGANRFHSSLLSQPIPISTQELRVHRASLTEPYRSWADPGTTLGKDTIPNVFVIESLRFSDEADDRFEGRILQQILRLSDRQSKYYYIRTRRELERVAKMFGASQFRYLHLSCHANSDVMATTLDHIPFEALGNILRPHLNGRRLFLSACEMATADLASEILEGSGCYSVIGPTSEINFSDAALLWSSFYHLMFRANESRMTRKWIKKHLQSTATLFGVEMNYFSKSSERARMTRLCVAP